MADWDVIIVGGGIAGASLGAEIATKRRTLIIEAEERCGYHATGRSAAFWLESYGGPKVAPLTRASREFLATPPANFSETSFLRQRGAIHLSREGWPELPEDVENRRLDRDELERLVSGIRPDWRFGVLEPGCADIDVGALHTVYLRQFARTGGELRTQTRLSSATFAGGRWIVELEGGATISSSILVNAAGAWADDVARRCGVGPLGIEPKRRTMVQLRVGQAGLRQLPLINDSGGTFYFKGEGDCSVWLTPHDEVPAGPCDAAPEEIDIATAIDRFQGVVDWLVERVERSWAGLRTFAPDRLPVYGFAPGQPAFFWCAGQGGFGIQTSPAAARLSASLILGCHPDLMVCNIDPASFSPARFA